MKRLFIAFICLWSSVSFSDDTSFQGLKKLNDYLYIGKKSDDLYLVMERIDDGVPGAQSRQKFWNTYYNYENKHYARDYLLKWVEGYVPKNEGYLQYKGSRDSFSRQFHSGLVSMGESFQYKTDSQLWVAYATCVPIAQASDIDGKGEVIEMVLPVMTSPDAPMTTHMGINRSFGYMLDKLKGQDRTIHRGISMDLHSFAAKCILDQTPDKQYMISAPVPEMTRIIEKSMPGGEEKLQLFIGTAIDIIESWLKNREKGDLKKPVDVIQKSYPQEAYPFLLEYAEKMQEVEKAQLRINDLEKTLDTLENDSQDAHFFKESLKTAKKDLKQLREEEQKRRASVIKSQLSFDGLKRVSPLLEDPYSPETGERQGRRMSHIQIYDKHFKTLLFEYRPGRQAIKRGPIVGSVIESLGKRFEGNDLKKFDWFFHPDMGLNKRIVVDLKALADLRLLSSEER